MKSLIISLISVVSLLAPSAQAFVSSEEETLLLQSLNSNESAQVHFEHIRCSARNRMCIVKMQLQPEDRKVGCMIERLNDSSDLYTETKVNGVVSLSLSPYAAEALQQCLRAVQ